MQEQIDDFEKLLRNNAIYSTDIEKIKTFPVNELLKEHKLKLIGKGFESRAFKIKGVDWVVKEGRWDLDFKPIINLTVKIPREQAQKLVRAFKFNFLPEKEEVLRQYGLYLKLLEYFAYFSDDEEFFHPNLDKLKTKQKIIRNNLSDHIEEMGVVKTLPHVSELEKILKSELKQYNFLPKEYLLYGDPVSPENKGKKTYFIFQEFIRGKTLYEHDVKNFTGKFRKLMILLSFLILLLAKKERIVPDLRPRYILQNHDWFGDTDNIIVNRSDLKMVDTRRVWETDSNFVKRGFVVPELVTLRAKHYLQHYLLSR